MNFDWVETTIKEFVIITMGQSPESKFYNSTGEGLPFLQGNRTFGLKYPSYDTYCTNGNRFAEKDDILISVRAPVGDLNIATEKICIGRGVGSLRMKNGNSNFLYYLMKANVHRFLENESGTVFGSINKSDIENIKLAIPKSTDEQRAIADVLSALDDKIELNRRMNATLEQLAQVIYKHMFINNPELETWEVKPLSNIADFVKGVSYSSSELVEESDKALVTLKSFNRGGGYKEEGLKPFAGIYKPQQRITPGEVVIAHTDLTQMAEVVGRAARVEENEIHTTLIASLDLVIVRPNQMYISNEYIFCLLAYGNFPDFAYGYTNGTTVLHLSIKALLDYTFPLPPSKIINEFSSIVTPLFCQIDLNNKQSRTLAELRDTLLPKLMSGQVRVKF